VSLIAKLDDKSEGGLMLLLCLRNYIARLRPNWRKTTVKRPACWLVKPI